VPKRRKKNKKRILALSLLCAAALCACSPKAPASSAPSPGPESSSSEPESKPEPAEEEESPVLEDITKDVALAEASDEAFRTQYPAEGWTFDNRMLFAVYQDEDASGRRVNANAIVSEPCDGELPDELVDVLKGQLETVSDGGMKINLMEMRTFCGEKVIYGEISTTITDRRPGSDDIGPLQ